MPAAGTPRAHLNVSVTIDSPGTVAFAGTKSEYPKTVSQLSETKANECGCSIPIYFISQIILAFSVCLLPMINWRTDKRKDGVINMISFFII